MDAQVSESTGQSLPYPNPAVAAAMASVAAAETAARKDPLRPQAHFRPPANWMNDPNGTIYHAGLWHLFYQHNPYGDEWGHMHWGHAVSRDLVRWEHWPIALWPSTELGEEHCFSGCAALDEAGRPVLLYTKVGPGPWEQWAAHTTGDWRAWRKYPDNPVLRLGGQGAPEFDPDWRDPYVFDAGGRRFLVLGVTLGDTAGVALYEAEDGSMVAWRYCKLLYAKPRSEVRFFECPNFIPMGGDRFILLTSPYGPVEYVAGRFDVDALEFHAESEGILDPGQSEDAPAHFYATNTAFGPDPGGNLRCVLFGWIRGYPSGRGWNGCLAFPRQLWLGPDGKPRQAPVPEIDALRGRHFSGPYPPDVHGAAALGWEASAAEIRLSIAPDQRPAGVALYGDGGDDPRRAADTVVVDGHAVWVAGQRIEYVPEPGRDAIDLAVYVDRSTVELFVDGGRLAVTKVLPLDAGKTPVVRPALVAPAGPARFLHLEMWELASIWD